MAYPEIKASNVAEQNSNTTFHSVAVPPYTSSDDVLLILVTDENAGLSSGPDSSSLINDDSWTSLIFADSSSAVRLRVWEMNPFGTDSTGGSVSVTTASDQTSVMVCMVIDVKSGGQIDNQATVATGTSSRPNPPLNDEFTGSDDFMVIAIAAYDRSSGATMNTLPPGFENVHTNDTSGGFFGTEGVGLSVTARDSYPGNTKNPGEFRLSSSDQWAAGTVIVRGSSHTTLEGAPQVVGHEHGRNDSNTTSHSLTAPAHDAGDILLVFFAADGNPTVTPGALHGHPWSTLNVGSNSSEATLGVYWMRAPFEHGDLGFTISTSSTQTSCWQVLRLNSVHSSSGPAIAVTTGTDGFPNPPFLNPSGWSTENTLWLAAASYDWGDRAWLDFPPDFVGTWGDFTIGGSGAVGLAVCHKEELAISKNPGSFNTSDPGDQWRAVTVAVRPLDPNTAPVANAGGDQTVVKGETVLLDAAGSTDTEDAFGSLLFTWSVLNAGGTGLTNADITDRFDDTASFVAPAISTTATITIRLTVEDTGGLTDTDDMTVTINPGVSIRPTYVYRSGALLPVEVYPGSDYSA